METLPDKPNLDHLRGQAKSLLKLLKSGDPKALALIPQFAPELASKSTILLHHAQLLVARSFGFPSWPKLVAHVEAVTTPEAQWLLEFCIATIGRGFIGPNLVRADALWERRPAHDPFSDAIRGEPLAGFDANLTGGPFNAPLLVYVANSGYWARPEFAERLLASARDLLDRGADPNGTYEDPDYPGAPLSALYAAAGRRNRPDLTALLLERGANPDDGESVYHACEWRDHTTLKMVLAAGAKTERTNGLLRIMDWEDPEGLALLLEAGADPNEITNNGTAIPIQHCLMRRRSTAILKQLLDAGADPKRWDFVTYALDRGLVEHAKMLGATEITQEQEFLAACARADRDEAFRLLHLNPNLIKNLPPDKLRLLPDLAAVGQIASVRLMIELGWPLEVTGGDWKATALNIAIFRGDSEMARDLLKAGASWETKHAFGDDARGTLSFASNARPGPGYDYAGCARALIEAGMPKPDPRNYRPFPDDVAEALGLPLD